MRPRSSVALVVVCAAAAWACNGIIGTTDIYYVDPNGPDGPDGGGSDTSTPPGDADVKVDSGPCGDTMTSGDNCGKCGHSCLGGQCLMGACQPVPIAASISPRDLYVDRTRVYWIEPNTAFMKESNLDGTSPVTLGGGTSNILMGLAVDTTNAYWGSLDGLILRCALTGCGGAPAQLTSNAEGVASVAVDDNNVYWVADPGSGSATINRLAKTATQGMGTVLATATTATGSFDHLVTDGQFVYFGAEDGMIRKVAVTGGAVTVIGKGSGEALNLVVDETNVYWSVPDLTAGTINKTAKDGSTPNGVVMTGSQNLPLGLAVDANNLYWVDIGSGLGGTDGTVMSCPLVGCSPTTTLAKNQYGPTNIAVDTTAIYWSNYSTGNPTGSVMRLAR